MKNTVLIFAIIMTLAVTSNDASAFSTEHRDTTNSDGTSRFADPDEQAPPFLAMQNDESGNGVAEGRAPSVTGPSVPDMLGAGRQGQAAFDHAYAHLQNQ